MTHEIFISYSIKDKDIADTVCNSLEGQGIRCWMAPRDILPGRDWSAAIVDAVSSARLMVLLLSSHSNISPQVRREAEIAVSTGLPIIPLRLEELEPSKSLRYFISSHQWLDAFPPILENHLKTLSQTIKTFLDRGEGDSTPTSEAAGAPPQQILEPLTRLPEGVSARQEQGERLPKWRMLILIAIASLFLLFSVIQLLPLFRWVFTKKVLMPGLLFLCLQYLCFIF